MNKSDKRLEMEEQIPQLFSDKHRLAYTTSEIMEQIDVDFDRRIYIDVLREIPSVREYNQNEYILWILPRMRSFSSLENRVSKLEEEIE
jgi:hypothetical protein